MKEGVPVIKKDFDLGYELIKRMINYELMSYEMMSI